MISRLLHNIIISIALLLILGSCTINFTSRNRGYARSNKEKISSVFHTGRKVDYVDFKDWKNHYLDDLTFDIFIDNQGGKIGVLSGKTYKPDDSHGMSENINTFEHLNKIMLDFEKKSGISWSSNQELNQIFVHLESENLERIFNSKPTQEALGIGIFSKKIEENKVLGSNRHIKLVVKNFESLVNWENDLKIADGLVAFSKSCDIFAKIGNSPVETKNIRLGTADLWYETCAKLKRFEGAAGVNNHQTRKFFEEFFTPVKVYQSKFGGYSDIGMFTGYYELDLPGSKTRTGKYKYPIYAHPPECKSGPCATRDQIFNGKIDNRGLELYYAKSNFDIFMLQIQGSGVVFFEDGTFARVGFGGTNRRSGRNIFSYMKKRCIPKCNASLTEIIEWFESNPEDSMDVLAQSDSYVFFRKLDNNGDGAVGAQGVALTPSRSIAVDDAFIPYGVPLWLETYIPVKDEQSGRYQKMKRLFIAQDTGEAITGAIRGDIFYGHGTKARYLAEKQKFEGSYYILVPDNVLAKVRVK